MQSTSILAASAVFDPSKRTVLPSSAAVNGPRFRRRDWALSAQVREILDEINLPMAPRPAADAPCESIIMEGAEIRRTMRTGSHVVRQNSTVALELDDTPAPPAFETVADASIQSAAAVALAQINERKPHARRGARLSRPALKAPSTASTRAMTLAFILAGVAVVALVLVVKGSL
jgi:hypothetical protein